MTEAQISAIRCALADLRGELQVFYQGNSNLHDWDAHWSDTLVTPHSRHTPGPWLYTQEGRGAFGIVEPDGASILHISTLSNSTGERHVEANARLIAAAPDLLLALETLLFNALHGNGLDALQQGHAKARAAIDKATQ